MMLLELREVNPRSPSLLEDEAVAQHLQEYLDTIPATQKHHTRTSNSYTNKSDRLIEPIAQHPLQSPGTSINTCQERTLHSSFVTLLEDEPHRNPGIPTRDPKLVPPTPLSSYPVPLDVASLESSAPLTAPPPPPQCISQALEDEYSSISPQKGKLILTLPPLLIVTMTGLAFLLYLLWC
ncbi:hypothetical protein HOY82DRAFT_567558, partial [Tuber indicum]